jgi:hypothetical protein
MARRAKSSDPIRRTMGESVTVRTKVVVAFFEPLLPLTVRVMTLSPTLESTLMVSTEVLFAGLVANVPVMPSGHPVRDNVTGALKPLAGLMVMVEAPEPPRWMAAAVAVSVKLPPCVGSGGWD